MSDELIIFGSPFPSIENDNKDYVPIWKQKVYSIIFYQIIVSFLNRLYPVRVRNVFTVPLRVDFLPDILILLALKKDGNQLNLYLVVIRDIQKVIQQDYRRK